MHTPEIKERFVELRGKGWSLARICQHLSLSKTTCIRWQEEFHNLIEELREYHLDEINEKVFHTYEEETTRLASIVNQLHHV